MDCLSPEPNDLAGHGTGHILPPDFVLSVFWSVGIAEQLSSLPLHPMTQGCEGGIVVAVVEVQTWLRILTLLAQEMSQAERALRVSAVIDFSGAADGAGAEDVV